MSEADDLYKRVHGKIDNDPKDDPDRSVQMSLWTTWARREHLQRMCHWLRRPTQSDAANDAIDEMMEVLVAKRMEFIGPDGEVVVKEAGEPFPSFKGRFKTGRPRRK